MCTVLLLFVWRAVGILITLLPLDFFLYLLKYHSKCTIGNIAQRCGQEANIARGKVKSYICLKTMHWHAIFPVVHECCTSSTLTGLLQHSTWSGYPVEIHIYTCTIVCGHLKGTTTVYKPMYTQRCLWSQGTSMYPRVHEHCWATVVSFSKLWTHNWQLAGTSQLYHGF